MGTKEYQLFLQNFNLFPKDKNRCIKTAEEFFKIPKEEWPQYWLDDSGTYSATTSIENNEPLIDIEAQARAKNLPIIFASGATEYGSTGNDLLLRKGAMERLFVAEAKVRAASDGLFTLMVTDAFRPLTTQRAHWDKIKMEFSHKEGLSGQALYDRICPLIADPDLQPPHCTGGAVDLTLFNLTTHAEVPMGTPIDVFDTELTWTWHSDITDPEIRKNRALLYWAMLDSGFINQPQEWWHYSYGEREWACRTGINQAIYKPL